MDVKCCLSVLTRNSVVKLRPQWGHQPYLALVRQLFEALGATYIKLGQFIASSPTLFPEQYVEEFQKCFDRAPAVPYAVIRDIIAAELGKPVDEVRGCAG